MATTALILHVQRATGSATAVGLLLFAQAVPPLLAPLAGVIADRFQPRRLLIAGWLAQAVLAGLLALLSPPLGALLVVVFALALVDTPLAAAVGRCVPAVVADDDLVAANALRSGVRELGTVLGPPLAGLLFAASGARLVLGLDALTFLLVVPLALHLPPLPSPARDTRGRFRPSVVRDARDGLVFIWHTPSVLAVALGFWVVVLFSAPDDLILPFLATLTFRAGPVAVGVLLAAASAGLLCGLPFVRPAGRRLGVTGAIVAGFAIMATGKPAHRRSALADHRCHRPGDPRSSDPPRGQSREHTPSAGNTTPSSRPGPRQRLRRGRRGGSRRLPGRRPASGCHLPAHSLRDRRLWRPGKRGRHRRIAPQHAAPARHPITVTNSPQRDDQASIKVPRNRDGSFRACSALQRTACPDRAAAEPCRCQRRCTAMLLDTQAPILGSCRGRRSLRRERQVCPLPAKIALSNLTL
jgi:MFS family permease